MSELRVAACEMRSVDDLEANQNQIREFLKNFEKQNVHLVSFPENSLYFRIRKEDRTKGVSESEPFFSELADWAKLNKTNIHLGSVALARGNGKLLNATVWIDSQGKMTFPYSKIHLFDVDVEGEKPVRESDFFAPGEDAAIVQIKDWKIGLSICYDLRFAELYGKYAKAEVDLILVPSAFLVTTGEAHWHTLLKARAIESQAFFVASAQGGMHQSGSGESRHTYGHSLIVGPWGETLAEVTELGSNFIVQTLNKNALSRVRKQIPMAQHRRL